MDEVLIAYATKHGSTHEVAESVAAHFADIGVEAHTLPAQLVESIDEYQAVVLGAPLYMGRWHRDARAFLRRFRTELASKPLAAFALGPTADEPKQWEEARAQLYRARDDVLMVTATLTLVLVDLDERKPCEIPTSFRDAIAAFEGDDLSS